MDKTWSKKRLVLLLLFHWILIITQEPQSPVACVYTGQCSINSPSLSYPVTLIGPQGFWQGGNHSPISPAHPTVCPNHYRCHESCGRPAFVFAAAVWFYPLSFFSSFLPPLRLCFSVRPDQRISRERAHFWWVWLYQSRKESVNNIFLGLEEPIRFSHDWQRFPFLAQI